MISYKKLDVWIFSMEMVKEIYSVTGFYPKEEMFGLTSQTKRAAVSVPTNIAEGLGRRFRKESVYFLHISRGSAYEVETLISVAVAIGILDQESYNRISEMLENCLRLLKGLINYFENGAELR